MALITVAKGHMTRLERNEFEREGQYYVIVYNINFWYVFWLQKRGSKKLLSEGIYIH